MVGSRGGLEDGPSSSTGGLEDGEGEWSAVRGLLMTTPPLHPLVHPGSSKGGLEDGDHSSRVPLSIL